MSHQRLLNALWDVRRGDPETYLAGVKFGFALGMAASLDYEVHRRLSDLILNAAEYARRDAKKEQAK